MSRIYFTTVDDQAEVRGYERSWGWSLGEAVAYAVAAGAYPDVDRLRELSVIPAGHYLNDIHPVHFKRSWRAAVSGFGEVRIHTPDGPDEWWLVAHNTACAVMSDPVVFASRMHLTCEVHGWVPREHGPWLAELVAQGLAERVMRDRDGWESVGTLAETAASEIVMSYSVGSLFPNAWEAYSRETFDPGEFEPGRLDEHGWEVGEDDWLNCQWGKLTQCERWDRAMAAVKANPITPDTLRARFGRGYSMLELNMLEWAKR